MNLFFDTNVLLDYLISTRPCHQDAGTLVKSVFCVDLNGFISSHSLTEIFYISRTSYSVEVRRQLLLLIVSSFQVISESRSDFVSVLTDKNFFDLEDGLQMKCAENTNLDYIVTENLKDFNNSKVPAVNIETALKLISK